MTPQPFTLDDIDESKDYLIEGKVLRDVASYAKGPWVEKVASRPAPAPIEYFITHDINCGEYSSTITVTSNEKPIQIDEQTVKVGEITIRFDSEIESIETMNDIEESLRREVQE